MALHSPVLHRTALHCIKLHCSVPCSAAALCCAMQGCARSAVQSTVALHSPVLHRFAPHGTKLHCTAAIQCCTDEVLVFRRGSSGRTPASSLVACPRLLQGQSMPQPQLGPQTGKSRCLMTTFLSSAPLSALLSTAMRLWVP